MTTRPASRGPDGKVKKQVQMQLPIITVMHGPGLKSLVNIDCLANDLHAFLVQLTGCPAGSMVDLASDKGMLANIQGAVDENPEEDATGQRAEGLLRKGGTYVALLCNPIDPAEVVTSFKGRPGAQQHGRASITLTWPDDTVIASKLFKILLDEGKRPKDYQIILPVTFKAALQDKTIGIIAKREELKALAEHAAHSHTPTKSAKEEKGKKSTKSP